MAATNVSITNIGDKARVVTRCQGTGAPANGDQLVLNLVQYPKGSEYLDFTGSKVWRRIAENKVAADWVGVALA